VQASKEPKSMPLETDDKPWRREMDWKIELIPVPVSDVDRAKRFYADQAGWVVDLDHQPNETTRLVQLTPPGSACSIMVGTGIVESTPGSLQGVQIVVSDIEAARAELIERGIECSPVRHFDGDAWVDGKGGDWNSFVSFSDPDGNGWVLQESPARS
jgi:predicted enzyme related to lactoylglutathione lyase